MQVIIMNRVATSIKDICGNILFSVSTVNAGYYANNEEQDRKSWQVNITMNMVQQIATCEMSN